MSTSSNPLTRFFRATWNGIDRARRITINLLFLAVVIGVLVLVFRNNLPEVKQGAALVVAPKGQLVEQLTARSFDQLIDEATGDVIEETLLKDVVDSINAAGDDERISVLVLNLNSFAGARLTKLQDVAEAVDNFKSSGKRVIAIADNYGQDSYYLAAQADEVIMNKMGAIMIEGMGRYRMYYREGIEKLGLDINVFKVGTFKSAVEPYLLDGMSEAAREANEEWLGDLWRIYLEDVGRARGMTAAQIDEYAQGFEAIMTASNGDSARAALDFGLADQALTRVETRAYLIEMVGEDAEGRSFLRTSMGDYLANLDQDRFGREAEGDKVAVVVARGTILDGSHPAGTIGGDSTAALIRKARNDDNVKVIVLRVDSGGGSAFASEVIRRELEAARAEGIIVIASMGSVAASGGYWISTSADQIWAHPSTITGSIGIFAMIPTYQRPLQEYLGIRVDGLSTAPLAGVRLDRELPEGVGRTIQLMIEQGYREFLERVAQARNMTTGEVDDIAQGRVWSGEDAYRLGLVDDLGDLSDAIAAGAQLAELGDHYSVSFVEKELKFRQQLINQLTSSMNTTEALSRTRSPVQNILRQVEDLAGEIGRFNDPNHVYYWSTIDTD